MPGERQLGRRREDPDPDVGVVGAGGRHEHRLRERHLLRERLHRRVVEIARVGEHRELVPLERRVGEDVGDDVAELCAYRPTTLSLGRGARDPRSPRQGRAGQSRRRCGRLTAAGQRGRAPARRPARGAPARRRRLEPAPARARDRGRRSPRAAGLDAEPSTSAWRPAPTPTTCAPPSPAAARPWSPSATSPTAARSCSRSPAGRSRSRRRASPSSTSDRRERDRWSRRWRQRWHAGDPGVRPAEELRLPRGASAASTSRSAPARCSGCSARTAPGRRPRSRSSRATASATAARSRCSARIRRTRRKEWRERLGVVLQSSSLYPNLTVRESLEVFGGYYASPRDADEVIEIVGLTEKAGARCRTLSGGQKRRLDLGLALVGNPELIFLDEPTTGFDPGARRAAWETIRNLRSLGTTILLTTHYLDEAEQLADRVAVLREGRIVRVGHAGRADRRHGRDRDPLPPERRGRSSSRRPSRRRRLLRADRRGGRARRGARRARGAPADARGRLPGADRRAREADVRLFVHELRTEQLLFWRNREAAFFTFFLPVILFLIFGAVYGNHRAQEGGRHPRRRVPRGRDDRLRRRGDLLRRARDHARDPARVRDPEADPLDAAPGRRPTSSPCSARRSSSS